MKLFGGPTSPFVRKVRVAAIEKGLAESITLVNTTVSPIDLNREVARENPLAKIPVLMTDDGMSLFDSLVICDYLDSLGAGARLIPAAGAGRWIALRLHAVGSGIGDAAILVRYETFSRPEALRWDAWTHGQLAKVDSALDWTEQHAAELGDPAGTGVNVGQVSIGCALGYLDLRMPQRPWRAGRPRLAAWWESFAARASMAATAPPPA